MVPLQALATLNDELVKREAEISKKKKKKKKKQLKDMRQSEIKFKKGEDGIKLKECKIKEYGQNDDKFENKIEALNSVTKN